MNPIPLEEIEAEIARRGIKLKRKTLLDIVPPNSEPQRQFIYSDADIVIYGGSAGGGKTFAELLEPTLDIHRPGFGAVIFRRTMKQVRDEGGIWDQSAELYPKVGGVANLTERFWTFPSGAVIQFAGIETDASVYNYQGAQIADILFDELTHFTESQFFYMMSRNRSQSGAKCRIRATVNPAPGWVRRFLAPWIDPKFPNPAKYGEIRWFIRDHNQVVWLDEAPNRQPCTKGDDGKGCYAEGCEDCFPPEKSMTFIRATIFDNKELLRNNPGYYASLRALDDVERKRLLDGDWDARPAHLVIDAFDEREHIVGWREIPKNWFKYVGADFGGVNGAEVVLTEDPHNGRLIVIGESWPGKSRSFKEIADGIREMCDGVPHAGAGGNRSTEQGWRQAMRREGIPMDEPNPAHTGPKIQYQCVNDLFRNGGLYIMDGCAPILVKMLSEMTRKIDPSDGMPTDEIDDTRFHLCAAIRYIITALRPPKSHSDIEPVTIQNVPRGTILSHATQTESRPWDLTGRFTK